jgi:glycine hydroxymethyltransferase
VTAGIAVAALEASQPEFTVYAQQIITNAKALGAALAARGFSLVTGGTDNHLLLIDLTNKGLPGKVAAQALDKAGIVLNYNSVPFDPRKPFDPSGLRIGTPAVTSRGMKEDVMDRLAGWIDEVVKAPADEALLARVAREVKATCDKYPAPGLRI